MSDLGGLVEYIVEPKHVRTSPALRQRTFTEHLLCAGHSAYTDTVEPHSGVCGGQLGKGTVWADFRKT